MIDYDKISIANIVKGGAGAFGAQGDQPGDLIIYAIPLTDGNVMYIRNDHMPPDATAADTARFPLYGIDGETFVGNIPLSGYRKLLQARNDFTQRTRETGKETARQKTVKYKGDAKTALERAAWHTEVAEREKRKTANVEQARTERATQRQLKERSALESKRNWAAGELKRLDAAQVKLDAERERVSAIESRAIAALGDAP